VHDHGDTATDSHPVTVRVAVLAAVIAASLAAASGLHLSGAVSGRSAPYDADSGAIAEALIGVVLAATAVALARSGPRSRRTGLLGFGFAIAGFGIGLSITAQGGHWPDITYHIAVLPLLLGCFAALLRAPRSNATATRDVTARASPRQTVGLARATRSPRGDRFSATIAYRRDDRSRR
jgi:hypothetical protein